MATYINDMEKARIRKGMHVRISYNISTTENSYGITTGMKSMRGEIHKVDDVWNSPSYGLSAEVRGYSWHAADLNEVSTEIEKDPELFHFDIKELRI